MTTDVCRPGDHPWYLDLRPARSGGARDGDATATLRALDAIGAIVLAVHVGTLPSLSELVDRRSYIGWTILVPGSVDRRTIETIAATAGAGYVVEIAPGHPLPPIDRPDRLDQFDRFDQFDRMAGHATIAGA